MKLIQKTITITAGDSLPPAQPFAFFWNDIFDYTENPFTAPHITQPGAQSIAVNQSDAVFDWQSDGSKLLYSPPAVRNATTNTLIGSNIGNSGEVPGYAFALKALRVSSAGSSGIHFGFSSNGQLSGTGLRMGFDTDTLANRCLYLAGGGLSSPLKIYRKANLALNTDYHMVLGMRSFAWMSYFYDTQWRAIMGNDADPSGMVPGIGTSLCLDTGSIGAIRGANLRWFGLFDPQDFIDGPVTTGQTIDPGEADFSLDTDFLTRPASGAIIIRLRQSDADNYLRIRIDATQIYLDKVVATVVTNLQTASYAANFLMRMLVYDNHIEIYERETSRIFIDETFNQNVYSPITFESTGSNGLIGGIRVWSMTPPARTQERLNFLLGI